MTFLNGQQSASKENTFQALEETEPGNGYSPGRKQ